jgi:hypothetical protein
VHIHPLSRVNRLFLMFQVDIFYPFTNGLSVRTLP